MAMRRQVGTIVDNWQQLQQLLRPPLHNLNSCGDVNDCETSYVDLDERVEHNDMLQLHFFDLANSYCCHLHLNSCLPIDNGHSCLFDMKWSSLMETTPYLGDLRTR